MDLVSVETSPENEWIKQRIVEGKVSSMTTVDGFLLIAAHEYQWILAHYVFVSQKLKDFIERSQIFMNWKFLFLPLLARLTVKKLIED